MELNHESGAVIPREKGAARFWEILDRDFIKLLTAGLLFFVSLIPLGAVILLSVETGDVPMLFLGGALGGMIAAPQLTALLDLILRSLRDQSFLWWQTYCVGWKRNLRSSMLPGAVTGILTVLDLFAFWKMRPEQIGVGMLFFFAVSAILIAALSFLVMIQIPIMELGIRAMFRNAEILLLRFLPRCTAAAIVMIGYSMVCYLFFPASLIFLMLLNSWFPILLAVMILYKPLNQVFEIEERLRSLQGKSADQKKE